MTGNLQSDQAKAGKTQPDIERLKPDLAEVKRNFQKVFCNAVDAVLIIEGDIFTDCNEATVKLLGASSKKEVLSTHPSELSPEMQPDGRSSFEKANEMITLAFDKGFHRFEWIHKKINGENFPVEVSLTAIENQGKVVLHVVWKDLTQQIQAHNELVQQHQQLEQKTRALEKSEKQLQNSLEQKRETELLLHQKAKFIQLSQEVTVTANEASNVEEALQVYLDKVCNYMNWPVGHVYITDSKGNLIPSKIWTIENTERFETLRKVTENTSFDPGVGLPGRVLATGKPAWIKDVEHDQNFPRAKSAKDIGVKAAFGLPVLEGEKVVAVLEFFSNEAVEPDKHTMEALSNLAVQVGRVTERKRAEESVRESEEKFRSITQTAWDAIISAGRNGNIVSWNNGAQAIFGYKEEEVLGKSLTMLMPERYRKAHINGLKLAATTGKFKLMGKTIELPGLRKDKSEFPLELSLGSWKTGKTIFFSAIIRDITERKQTEGKLRKLSRAVEQSPASVMITDTEGHIEYCNPKFCEVTGYSLEEVIGQNPRILKSGKKSTEDYKELWSMITSGKEWRGEFNNKKKNGKLFWELSSISPIKNPAGEITHFLAIKEDITKRKQIEEELAEERRNLKKTVETRTKELRESIKNLEKTNKAKSAFLSSMSHELRTPLNSILGFSQLMDTDKDNPPNPSQKENLDQIQKSGKHLLDLINEILDLTKIESGKLPLSLESISVRNIMDEVNTLMEPVAEEYEVTIINNTSECENLFLVADHTRIKQILINIITNGIKYNHKSGSVTITCEKHGEKRVRLSVEDTGKGISKENIPKLFDPFNRLGAEGLDIEGTGIGLTITKKLVEMMGGEIGVESEVGKGSNFFVAFPAAEKPDKAIIKKSASARPVSEKQLEAQTILYIEDNPANLKLVQKILERRPNIKLFSSPEAKTGIELAIKHKPDLILMDINLPGMNGYEALNELRTLDETNKIPVIAVSANAMASDIKKGKKAGFRDYVTKPINVNNFLDKVDKVLAQWN